MNIRLARRIVAIAEQMDLQGQPDLANRFDQILQRTQDQQADWQHATGEQMEGVRGLLRQQLQSRQPDAFDADQLIEMARRKFGRHMSREQAQTLLIDERRRLQKPDDPWIDRVGEFVLEGGFSVEDIEQYTEGRLDSRDIVEYWKKFIKFHPNVRRDLLKRKDIVHARPTGNVDPNLRQDPSQSDDPIERARHEIGEASPDAKVQMRSLEDLDEAAMETYRLALQPQYQKLDGSPNMRAIAKIVGGSENRIKRQLERAKQVASGQPTLRPSRDPGDRDAARDLVSEMASDGWTAVQILEALNETATSAAERWTDNNMWGLFTYRDNTGHTHSVPFEHWGDYREFLQQVRSE